MVFAGRQDSQYLDCEDDEFDVAAALAMARAIGLVKGCEAEFKPVGNGRPQGWGPRLEARLVDHLVTAFSTLVLAGNGPCP